MIESIARIPHDARRDYDEDYIAERRAWLGRQTGASLTHVARYSIEPEDARGNIENFIGIVQVPLGGPPRAIFMSPSRRPRAPWS